ncbi:MAG TPA: hypothetical protein VMZ91_16375 [Candidatus Paceibacterota bacterium]|nr:hypothetical protein [Candidatus Paceibacterota bacterium]
MDKTIEINAREIMEEIHGDIAKLEELSNKKFTIFEKIFTGKSTKNLFDKLALIGQVNGYLKLGFKLQVIDKRDPKIKELMEILKRESA